MIYLIIRGVEMEMNAIKFYRSPYDFVREVPYQTKLVLRRDVTHKDEVMVCDVGEYLQQKQGKVEKGRSGK